MGIIVLTIVFIVWNHHELLAKMIVDVHEDLFDCEETLPLPAADFSQLEFELDEKDTLTVSGAVTVTEDYEAPIGLNFYSKHLERGEWKPGFLSKVIKDFCPDILNPTKPWYFVTKTLNQTRCPYRKGHVEVLDHLKFGTYGLILPQNMLGEWKMFYEITTKRNGQMVKECAMRRAFLTDG